MEITVEKVDTGVQKLGFQALSTLKTVRVAVYARVSTDQGRTRPSSSGGPS